MVIRKNLEDVLERIEGAKARAGRRDPGPRLMAVTKTQTFEAVQEAYDSGLRLFGENRVQEAAEKFSSPPEGSEVHLIGHLQRNKARQVPGLFSAVHSIDSVRTARALTRALADSAAGASDDHRESISGSLDILLEVNTSGEESKFGYRDVDSLLRDAEEIAAMPQLRIVGLMTMAPFVSDEALLRRSFSQLRDTLRRLQQELPELPATELSMGMSNDFEIAVEEGSTVLRLGTVLFGDRR